MATMTAILKKTSDFSEIMSYWGIMGNKFCSNYAGTKNTWLPWWILYRMSFVLLLKRLSDLAEKLCGTSSHRAGSDLFKEQREDSL